MGFCSDCQLAQYAEDGLLGEEFLFKDRPPCWIGKFVIFVWQIYIDLDICPLTDINMRQFFKHFEFQFKRKTTTKLLLQSLSRRRYLIGALFRTIFLFVAVVVRKPGIVSDPLLEDRFRSCAVEDPGCPVIATEVELMLYI